jgi:hypothetical protein
MHEYELACVCVLWSLRLCGTLLSSNGSWLLLALSK